MGKFVLGNKKGQKVEITFEGRCKIKAHKDNVGTCFMGTDFFFISTDQEYEEDPKASKNEAS